MQLFLVSVTLALVSLNFCLHFRMQWAFLAMINPCICVKYFTNHRRITILWCGLFFWSLNIKLKTFLYRKWCKISWPSVYFVMRRQRFTKFVRLIYWWDPSIPITPSFVPSLQLAMHMMVPAPVTESSTDFSLKKMWKRYGKCASFMVK